MNWWEIQGFSRASNIRKDVKKKRWFPLDNRSTHDRVAILVFSVFWKHWASSQTWDFATNMGYLCVCMICVYTLYIFFKQNSCSNILLALQSDKLTIHKFCLKLTWIYCWDHMAELQRSHRDVTGMMVRIGVTIPIAFFGWLVSVQPDTIND